MAVSFLIQMSTIDGELICIFLKKFKRGIEQINIFNANILGRVFCCFAVSGKIAVVGFAVWQRSFAEQAGNYGRMVEHSTVASSGSNRGLDL